MCLARRRQSRQTERRTVRREGRPGWPNAFEDQRGATEWAGGRHAQVRRWEAACGALCASRRRANASARGLGSRRAVAPPRAPEAAPARTRARGGVDDAEAQVVALLHEREQRLLRRRRRRRRRFAGGRHLVEVAVRARARAHERADLASDDLRLLAAGCALVTLLEHGRRLCLLDACHAAHPNAPGRHPPQVSAQSQWGRGSRRPADTSLRSDHKSDGRGTQQRRP